MPSFSPSTITKLNKKSCQRTLPSWWAFLSTRFSQTTAISGQWFENTMVENWRNITLIDSKAHHVRVWHCSSCCAHALRGDTLLYRPQNLTTLRNCTMRDVTITTSDAHPYRLPFSDGAVRLSVDWTLFMLSATKPIKLRPNLSHAQCNKAAVHETCTFPSFTWNTVCPRSMICIIIAIACCHNYEAIIIAYLVYGHWEVSIQVFIYLGW